MDRPAPSEGAGRFASVTGMEVSGVADFVEAQVSEDLSSRDRADEDFRTLFEAAYGPVVRTVWLVVHDRALAEEVAQDAFVELFRHWSAVRHYERPDLWVRRVAIRRAQREASRTRRRTVLERVAASDPTRPHPTTADAADELPDAELLAAIRTLSPRQRAIVVLFYLEDRPMAEVADLVGCSSSTGFVHLHHARHRLADLLGEEVDGHVH